MNIFRLILALGVGALLVFFGVTKFTGAAHIFPFIEYNATALGVPLASLAWPFGNYATGTLELLAGILLIVPGTRKLGAHIAVLPFLGATIFHLSPLLGISTPTGYADPLPTAALSAGGPFVRTDFAAGETTALFMTAAIGFLLAVINLSLIHI